MNETQHKNATTRPEARIDELSREISHTIDSVREEDRAMLREYAANLVREGASRKNLPAPQAVPRKRVSPLSLAALLVGTGGVFLFILPPVGVTLLLCALLPLAWGVGRAIVSST